MLDCLLALLAVWVWVALVPEAEGGDSPTPPTPPPPPPAAKAGVNEGAATSVIENVASAANLMIIQLAMQTSCIPARWSPRSSRNCLPRFASNIPGKFFREARFGCDSNVVLCGSSPLFCESQSFARTGSSAMGPGRVKTFFLPQKLHAAGRNPR